MTQLFIPRSQIWKLYTKQSTVHTVVITFSVQKPTVCIGCPVCTYCMHYIIVRGTLCQKAKQATAWGPQIARLKPCKQHSQGRSKSAVCFFFSFKMPLSCMVSLYQQMNTSLNPKSGTELRRIFVIFDTQPSGFHQIQYHNRCLQGILD